MIYRKFKKIQQNLRTIKKENQKAPNKKIKKSKIKSEKMIKDSKNKFLYKKINMLSN